MELYCALPPCFIRHESEPPANGANRFRSVGDYLEHVEKAHFISANNAPQPLQRVRKEAAA